MQNKSKKSLIWLAAKKPDWGLEDSVAHLESIPGPKGKTAEETSEVHSDDWEKLHLLKPGALKPLAYVTASHHLPS